MTILLSNDSMLIIISTTFYGDIPLLTSAASDFEEFHTPVSTREQIMVQVVEDFTDAKNNLPVFTDIMTKN